MNNKELIIQIMFLKDETESQKLNVKENNYQLALLRGRISAFNEILKILKEKRE